MKEKSHSAERNGGGVTIATRETIAGRRVFCVCPHGPMS